MLHSKRLKKLLHSVTVGCLCLPATADGLDPTILKPDNSLPVNGYQFDPVVHNGRIYVAGGYNGVSFNTVYVAPINADGTLGLWDETTPLPELDQGPGVTVARDRLFVALLNGHIYSAPINGDGSVGSWTQLATAAADHGGRLALEAYEDRLYLFGGWSGGTFFNDVFTTVVNPDGSLGGWVQLADMPGPRQHTSVHFYNDRVYIVGGIQSVGNILDNAWSAPVNASGTLGAWRSEPDLPHPLWYHNSALVDGEIFLFGGRSNYDGSGANSTIYRGRIDPTDGSIMGWEDHGCLPGVHSQAIGVVYAPDAGGNAYLIGGGELGSIPTDQVLRNKDYVRIDGVVDIVDLLDLLGNWLEDGCDVN